MQAINLYYEFAARSVTLIPDKNLKMKMFLHRDGKDLKHSCIITKLLICLQHL